MEKTKTSMHLNRILNKFFEKLIFLTPSRRIYFIYTHDLGSQRFRYGLKANTEISYWSFQALKRAFPRVVFLRIQEEKKARIDSIRSQDIVIGHVGETFLRASQRTKRLIAFYPWAGHEDRSINTLFNCLPFEKEKIYWEKAASLVLLTSEFNRSVYLEKPSNFWHPFFTLMQKQKSIRIVHQPLDLTVFLRNKVNYETSDFLYIGNDAHMKCVDDAKRLVSAVGRTFHLYGIDGRFFNHLNANQVAALPQQADFFIQPGMWEGQCVSILEAAARGFIPVVSPETGYPYDHPFLLRHNDFNFNLDILKKLLQTTPGERKLLADTLYRQLVSDHHHNQWKTLTTVLLEEVEKLL